VNSISETADFIIIGGGIAGASAGYELCKKGRVVILEKESQLAYHTTGRSSAIFQLGYNKGDGSFYSSALNGVSVTPLLPLRLSQETSYLDRVYNIKRIR